MVQWGKIEIPLAAGLDTKDDARAGQPPKLDIARDVQFEEIGGLQTRKPFPGMSNTIFGGGTLANCRRLAVVNDELVVFTDDEMYSWNAQLATWVLRATHLAVAVDETPAGATTDDQIDGDRAELNGTIVYTWTVTNGAVQNAFVRAIDKTTGAILLAPTILAGGGRTRLVALSTRILLFGYAANNLTVIAIDPASPASGLGSPATVLAAAANEYYDVVRAGTQDLCVGAVRRVVTTSYTAFTVTPALAVATSTKARVCDGPIAVSAIPDGTQTQVARGNGANIQGDLLTTSTLADVFTGQAIGSFGSPVNQIAACHRSVQNGGAFRCFVFWTGAQSPTGLTWGSAYNWVDNAGALGVGVVLALQIVVASRAFDCNGSVYVWLAFGSSTIFATPSGFLTGTTLQNSYFLYRDDAFLCAKAVAGSGGGFPPSTGRIPGVSTLSSTSFAWCAARRRKFVAGSERNADFAARTPVDVSFQFDSNEARRSAIIGRTGYVAAGEILQYDGTRLVETGFHVSPWAVGAIESPGGSLTAGAAYAYKGTWRYANAQDESERSSTATIGTITLTVGTRVDLTSAGMLTVTHKTTVAPGVEFWRTVANPGGADDPFKLITSNDPNDATNPNRYLANDPATGFGATIQDTLSDVDLASHEANPENGSALPAFGPPAAKIIIATDTRLFLARVAGDPDAIWYSQLRDEGEIASFNDTLRVLVPCTGGVITAIAFNNETLTVFRETAIYALPGDGLDNNGLGQNFGPARVISFDVGAVNHESVALTPLGTVFKSRKGWYLLSPSWSVQYIGAQVTAFDSEEVLAVHVVESQHHVRILTENRMIVWDYSAGTSESPLGQWGEWTISTPVHAVMWDGRHVLLTPTGPVMQALDYTGTNYGIDVETAWIKPAEQQGDVLVKTLTVLGEYRSAHLLRIRVARDYQYDGAGNVSYFDDVAWTPTPTTVGSALQVTHPPSISRCEAIKIRLTAVTEATRATLITTALSPQIATDGTVWNSTWTAASSLPGLMGNALTMSVAFTTFTPVTATLLPADLPFEFFSETGLIVVNDHYAWNLTTLKWHEDKNNIGVLVAGTVTVADLETAIAAATVLATLSSADASPAKVVNSASLISGSASFSGGAYGSPTGEALKLTGLAAEIGVQRGVRRLAAGQKA